jgi:hypothetical protein
MANDAEVATTALLNLDWLKIAIVGVLETVHPEAVVTERRVLRTDRLATSTRIQAPPTSHDPAPRTRGDATGSRPSVRPVVRRSRLGHGPSPGRPAPATRPSLSRPQQRGKRAPLLTSRTRGASALVDEADAALQCAADPHRDLGVQIITHEEALAVFTADTFDAMRRRDALSAP